MSKACRSDVTFGWHADNVIEGWSKKGQQGQNVESSLGVSCLSDRFRARKICTCSRSNWTPHEV